MSAVDSSLVGTESYNRAQQVQDDALLAEPRLVASVSAGNEGPGLSTVGTPAGSTHAWTAGAPVPGLAQWTPLAARLAEKPRAPAVVILTTFARPGYLRRALDAGVRGYLLKDAPSDQLAAAKEAYGWTTGPFVVPDDVKSAWEKIGARGAADRADHRAGRGRPVRAVAVPGPGARGGGGGDPAEVGHCS